VSPSEASLHPSIPPFSHSTLLTRASSPPDQQTPAKQSQQDNRTESIKSAMSTRTIEVASIPLKPGLDLATGAAKTAWQASLATTARQQGARAVFWGYEVEHPGNIQMVVEWDTLASHEAFVAAPTYKPFMKTLEEEIFSGAPSISHIELRPAYAADIPDPFTQPVTECFRAYFPASFPASTYDAHFATFQAAAASIADKAAGGLAGGWSVEPARHESLGADGVPGVGKMFAVFIGWPSLEAHARFKESEHFERMVELLRKGLSGAEMVHVGFERFK